MVRASVFLIGLLFLSASSRAAEVTIVSTNVGTYNGSPAHFANNYTVSEFPAFPAGSFRNYAIFDLSSITDPIASAEIRTNSGGDAGRTEDVTIVFRSFTGNLPDLTAGTADYDSLDDGDVFGSFFAASNYPDNAAVTVDLNATAVAALNSTSGLIAITGVQAPATNSSGFFGDVPGSQVQLVVTTTAVPEPSSALVLASIVGFGMVRRRRR